MPKMNRGIEQPGAKLVPSTRPPGEANILVGAVCKKVWHGTKINMKIKGQQVFVSPSYHFGHHSYIHVYQFLESLNFQCHLFVCSC